MYTSPLDPCQPLSKPLLRAHLHPIRQKKKLTLQIKSYDRGRHPVHIDLRPYHSTLLINNGPSSPTGTVYQLKGMPGGFHYDGPEPNEDITVSGSKLEDIDMGEVLASRLIEFEKT